MTDLPTLVCPSPFDDMPAGLVYVIVVGVAADGQVAFVRSSEARRSWELPGGAIEADESIEEAAIREFHEETGWRLEGVIEAACIENVIDGQVQSHAFVVAGSFVEESSTSADGEVKERAVMRSAPKDCTFGEVWVDQLIGLGVERLMTAMNRKMWGHAAASYDDDVEISERDVHYGPLIPGESVLRLLPPLSGTRVLDLGCGGGHNLAALAYLGAATGLGIDFSREQVERARRRAPTGFEIVEADMTSFSFVETGPFDLVLSVFAVAFVANLDVLLEATARSLRPGGVLVVSTDHPRRSGAWRADRPCTSDWFAPSSRKRVWEFPSLQPAIYFHHLHDLPTIVGAVAGAGLVIEAVREPRACGFDDLSAAPYRSAYYVARHEELRRAPYTLVLKARKPHS